MAPVGRRSNMSSRVRINSPAPGASFRATAARIASRGRRRSDKKARTSSGCGCAFPDRATQFDTQRLTSPFTVANGGVAIGAIEADVALPAPVGSPITFKARATGGPAPLQYRFYRLDRQTNAWTLARDFSPVDSYTWTPTAGQQGSYTIQVWVRGAGSTAAYDTYRSSDTFAIADAPPNIAIVKTETSFPAATGAPITWKAVASGGPGPLEYRFYRLARATNTWTLVQDYGPSNTYMWTPGASEQGTYALQAWVRRAGTAGANDAWWSTPDFQIANSAAVIRSITSDAGAPMPAGAPVTWKVAAGGGSGALQYQFWLYSAARDSWSMFKDFSASNSFTWVPGLGEAGTYQLQVAIRSAGSTTVAASATTTPFDVVPNSMPVFVSLTRDTGTTLRPGMPIVWTAKVAGGLAPLDTRSLAGTRRRSSTRCYRDTAGTAVLVGCRRRLTWDRMLCRCSFAAPEARPRTMPTSRRQRW